jgi:formylglycine-generating enzyme required for sulfatase activity
MKSSPSRFKGDNRPVEQVSWDDICQPEGFLDRLNKMPDIADKNAKDGKKFCLPTEAQ